MGSGNPEAVQLSTSSSPSFAVIFESWRISGGTVNNAKDVTNTELARFFLFTNPKDGSHVHIFFNFQGGTPLYGLYRYGHPERVWLLAILVSNS